MKNQTIIGYKIKNRQYENAAVQIVQQARGISADCSKTFKELDTFEDNTFDFQPNSLCKKALEYAGVLDLWFEPVYKEEPKLEIGEWYKSVDCYGDPLLYCVTEIDEDGDVFGYGFSEGEFRESECNIWGDVNDSDFEPATDKEVEQALIKEAEKRGFKEGVKVNPPSKDWSKNITLTRTEHEKEAGFTKVWYKSKKEELIFCGVLIYRKGKWAEIIELSKEGKPTKEELLQELENLKEKISLL